MIGRAALFVALVAALPSPIAAEGEFELHRKQACDKTTGGWCLARSTGGGFSVELPMPFNDFTLPDQTFTTGGKGHADVVGGVLPGTGKLSVTCFRFKEGRPDAESIYANLEQTAGRPEPFEHKGFTGRRYRKSQPQGEAAAFVGSNFMCLLVAESTGDASIPAATLERFFGSFTFPTGATPPEGPR